MRPVARLHHGPAEFMRIAGGLLSAEEAENSLPLGLCLRMMTQEVHYDGPPFFHTSESDSGLTGAAIMTPPHNVVLCCGPSWPDEAFVVLCESLLEAGYEVPGVLGRADLAARFASSFSRLSAPVGGIAVEKAMRLGLFLLEKVTDIPTARGFLRAAALEDLGLLAGWYLDFHRDCFGEVPRYATAESFSRLVSAGDVFVWDDDGPVSLAAKSRPTWNGVTISMVYTPPLLRNRGYASSCVAELSRLLLNDWRFCTLFTDLANHTPNHIYETIGYHRIAEFAEYRFSR